MLRQSTARRWGPPRVLRLDSLTENANALPYVRASQSLTTVRLPVKTPFGVSALPAVHIEDTSFYATDRAKLIEDERFIHNFISEDATATVVLLKTKDKLTLDESGVLMHALDSLIKPMNFQNVHYLGRANFQKELVAMEKREVAVSTGIAAILVGIIMTLLFRRWRTVVLTLSSIGLAMLFFLGLLGAAGRELSAMAALYPVLMVIIGTSDAVHMLSKYIDELRRGHSRTEAISLTIKEIGLATLMTAVTTAVGFATLVTSRIKPIQDFGINAAVGVMVAYVTVLIFTTAVMSFFEADELIFISKTNGILLMPMKSGEIPIKSGRGGRDSGFGRIERFMEWVYEVTRSRAKVIATIAAAMLLISVYGVSKITTNSRVSNNMPNYSKVTDDFLFF